MVCNPPAVSSFVHHHHHRPPSTATAASSIPRVCCTASRYFESHHLYNTKYFNMYLNHFFYCWAVVTYLFYCCITCTGRSHPARRHARSHEIRDLTVPWQRMHCYRILGGSRPVVFFCYPGGSKEHHRRIVLLYVQAVNILQLFVYSDSDLLLVQQYILYDVYIYDVSCSNGRMDSTGFCHLHFMVWCNMEMIS